MSANFPFVGARLPGLLLLTLALSGCVAYPEIRPTDGKPHHGEGEYVSVKKGSFLGHFMMRQREPDPPPRDPDEVRSLIGDVDRELLASAATRPRVTWIGHATSLVQYRGVNYLTDPHLTEYPFHFEFGVEPRYTPPALRYDEMPEIDFVVISHNHYDSLDHRTVDHFGDGVTWYVPLGLKAWFLDRGIAAERVIELDWWDSHRHTDRVEVTLVPAQHWSKRTPWDTNRTLWGGWVVRIEDFDSYFVGDTGYNDEYFRQIGERFGPFDLAMIPIGAYAPRYFMASAHIDPAQAVDLHLRVGARRSLPIHWGTFQLTIEPILEPAQLLRAEMQRRGLPLEQFQPVKIGETLVLD